LKKNSNANDEQMLTPLQESKFKKKFERQAMNQLVNQKTNQTITGIGVCYQTLACWK
jgi:hypothetical protein